MKIKTQFINSMIIFGIILLIIATSVIITNQQVERLNKQEEIAKNIERGSSELGYLSNDYLLYHESPQRARWESKFSELSTDLSNLNPNSPEQQTLVNNIRSNQQRLKAVFTDVVSTFENTSGGADQTLFQISWSRMAVQNQGMAFDAARLSQMLRDQADQLKQTNIVLIFALLCVLGLYFFTNYLIVYRRALRSISDLQDGTRIIGSGNFDFAIKQKSDDEIGELSHAFNRMTANLKEVTASKAELEREITERKRAENALRESEQRWATTLASIGDAVIATDVEGRIIFMNAVAEGLTGWSLVEASTKLVTEVFNIISEYTRREADNPVTRVLKEGTIIGLANHTILLRKNGTEVQIDDSGAPIIDRDGKTVGVVLVFRDITERRRAEEALRKAHDELEARVQERTAELKKANEMILERTAELEDANIELEAKIEEQQRAEEQIRKQAELLDKAQDAIGLRDLEHSIIYWNKGAQRLYGWTTEEIIGKNADQLLYKEESPNLIEAKKRVIEKGEWIGELRQRTKEGKEIIVESRWTLVRDNEEKPRSILIINTDITEKKKLEAQLLRAQRMESIGTLAGGIAHDLNNILTPIMLSLQILKGKFKDEQSKKLLTILENNTRRGADLIKQVLSFAQRVEGERIPLQAKHIIIEIENIAKETFPKNIEIRTDIHKALFTISGDATQLHQVLMNLCLNARDAMPDGGILKISAENFFVNENYARQHADAKVGSYVVISVSDTGIGIPPEILDRIFEPFFSTKKFGKGTGLGLSTALAIVKSHAGFINVYSEIGKGTTFGVYLPAIKTEMQNIKEQHLELATGHGEFILVAEDEALVREVTASTLEKYGYSVLAANDGADAVALYVQNKDKIKVILMDMMMPVMDGEASIQAIRKINPEVKVIVVSGLAEKDKLAKIESTHAHTLLPKPYTAEKLLKTIYEVIGTE